MHEYPDKLSDVIKATRQQADITVEMLAERIGVTERYLYRIENENRKPSYDILFRMVRELNLPPNLVFYPEKTAWDSDLESIVCMLYSCDERSMAIIKETVKAALESQKK